MKLRKQMGFKKRTTADMVIENLYNQEAKMHGVEAANNRFMKALENTIKYLDTPEGKARTHKMSEEICSMLNG